MIRPGEIYLADLDKAGKRPVIVVSREELNRGNYVLVAPCTTARLATRQKLSNCVPLYAGHFGLTSDCVAQCENLLSLEIAALGLTIGRLDNATMRSVVKAIGYVIDSDCEPN